MSSPIDGARCISRDAARVDIALEPTEASGAHFPFSRFFGLWLLHEAATTMVSHDGKVHWRSGAPAGAIGGALTYDDLADLAEALTPDEQLQKPPSPAARRALLERKRELEVRFVASVSYGDVRNWEPMLCELDDVVARYLEPATKATPRFHEAGEALQRVFDRATVAKRPQATLRIEVTEPRWIEHLEPGMTWDVYVYESDGDELL